MKTSFFLLCTAIIVSVCSLPSIAQDTPQIGLPEDVIARIGKGDIGKVQFSPDGRRLAISSSIGIWFYDPATGEALDLLPQTDSTTVLISDLLPFHPSCFPSFLKKNKGFHF